MEYTFKSLAAVLLVTAFALNSCDEDVTEVQPKQNETILTEGLEKNPLVIDGGKKEWHFSLQPRKLTKGLLLDEASYYESIIEDLRKVYGDDYKLIDTLRFTYKNQNYETKLLRVDRKSEPGKYFYVMIDNLSVKLDTACWAYADDEENVQKYGRLYSWRSAQALAKEITMRLPVYEANNPTQKKFGGKLQLPVKARLLSRKDICDIIECDAIGHLPENGYSLDNLLEQCWDNLHAEYPLFYYDVFVGGLDGSDNNYIEYFRGEHSLAGGRGAFQQPEWAWPYYDGYGWYNGLNRVGFFWTCDTDFPKNPTAFFEFRIEREDVEGRLYNYVAFINSMCSIDGGGISVRYVFEPQYK